MCETRVVRGEVAVRVIAWHNAPSVLIALLVLTVGQVDPAWYHEHWDVEDGLPVNGIGGIAQSADGYIWAATHDGLARFDGVRFVTFDDRDARLTLHDFTSVTVGPDGAIWLSGPQRELLQLVDGIPRHVQQGLPGGEVTAVFARGDTLLFGATKGVSEYRNGRLFEVVRTDTFVTGVARTDDGTLYYITEAGRVFRQRDGRTEQVFEAAGGDSASLVLSATQQPILVTVDRFVTPVGGDEVAVLPAVYRLHGSIARVDRLVHVDDRIFGSLGGFTRTRHEVLHGDRVVFSSPGIVVALHIASDGAVWFAVAETGLHRLTRKKFSLVGSDAVYGVEEADDGDLWLSTLQSGLHRYRGPERTLRIARAEGLDASHAWITKTDRQGRVWVGGFGLCWLDGDRCRSDGVDPALSKKQIRLLYTDRRDRLWVGADAMLFTLEDQRWRRRDLEWRIQHPIMDMHEVAGGALWFASHGQGVLRVDREGVRVFGADDGLDNLFVRSFFTDGRGDLWATGYGGLYRFDPANGRFSGFDRRHGLIDNGVHRVLRDDQGRYWMSSNRGIFWVHEADLYALADGSRARVHPVAYGRRHGLDNPEANTGGIRTRDGRLLFPTQKGLAVIDPRAIETFTSTRTLVIEEFVVNDRALTVRYTAPHFDDAAQLRFRYRLVGFDADWVDAKTRRRAFYTNLGPGAYRFEVALDGGSRAVTRGFAIAPRWFETTGFFLACLAAAFAAVFALVRVRVRALEQRQAELQSAVAERTAELERQTDALKALDRAKSHFFSHINHELRTPLTLITGPLSELLNDELSEDVRSSLQVMKKNGDRLSRMINRILELERLESGAYQPRPEPLDVLALARRVTESFAGVTRGERIVVTSSGGAWVNADPEMVETSLINLVGNAVKHGGRRIEISAAKDGDEVVLRVQDDGPGITPEDLPKVFDRLHRGETDTVGSGLGLALVKEMTEAQGGRVAVQSDAGAGALFTVTLPRASGGGAPPAPTTARASDAVQDDRPVALIVDDNDDLREFVASVLSRICSVAPAADGDEALRHLKATLPDVVIADVMMPGLNGLELTRVINADPAMAGVPVLMLTARAAAEDEVAGFEAGAADYLTKPFDPDVLRARVLSLLDRRGPIDSPAVPDAPAEPEFVAKAREVIEARIDAPITVADLARALAVSRTQLFRKLGAEAEMTPSVFIQSVRLDRGRALLIARSGNVSEIAYAVGFKSAAHFSRQFRERFGFAPSKLLRK